MTAMGWFTTADAGEFLAVAGEFLRAEPARNTVMLTVTEDLRVQASVSGRGAPALTAPLFGWWQDRVVLAFRPAPGRLGCTGERT